MHHLRTARRITFAVAVGGILLTMLQWSTGVVQGGVAALALSLGLMLAAHRLGLPGAGYGPVHAIVAISLVCLTIVAHQRGGLLSPTLGWFPVLVAVTMLTLPLRTSLAWTSVISASLFLHVGSVDRDHWPPDVGVPVVYALARALTCVAVAWCVSRFELSRRESTAALVREGERARRMLSDLETKHRELALAREQALAASRSKSEFLANMSHELRTPLTALLGYADLLRDHPEIADSPPRRRETLDTIRGAGQHLLTVICDILDLSKIEAGKLEVERHDVDLPGIIAGLETLVRSRADEKGLAFHVVVDGTIPRTIRTDSTRVRQVLLNLLGNAIKFTSVGAVTLRLRADPASCRLTCDVEDTGPGISTELAQRLFNPFSQVDSSASRIHGGTGLGLAISRRLAHLVGGEVLLRRSTPGHGACFRFELALDIPALADWTDSLDRPSLSVTKPPKALPTLKGRILLAEDGPDNQRLITFLLRKSGAEVEVVPNGREALERLRAAEATGTPFELLLTDVQMPVMDGHTLARTLRAEGSRIGIVALTAHAMEGERDRCLEAGCDDYAAKPIERSTLITTCHRWLGRPSSAAPVACGALGPQREPCTAGAPHIVDISVAVTSAAATRLPSPFTAPSC
ncbi:MAG: response regulator [Myxococcales bacterium]|nr:response regulator [Myxococcales bacterium]